MKKVILVLLAIFFSLSVLLSLIMFIGGGPDLGIVFLLLGIIGLIAVRKGWKSEPISEEEKELAKEALRDMRRDWKEFRASMKKPDEEAHTIDYDDDDDDREFEPDEEFSFDVAGLAYEGRLEKVKSDDFGDGGTSISLVSEPDNPHDPDAIMVVHHKLGQIGYVPADETWLVREYIKCIPNYTLSYDVFEYEDGKIDVEITMSPGKTKKITQTKKARPAPTGRTNKGSVIYSLTPIISISHLLISCTQNQGGIFYGQEISRYPASSPSCIQTPPANEHGQTCRSIRSGKHDSSTNGQTHRHSRVLGLGRGSDSRLVRIKKEPTEKVSSYDLIHYLLSLPL